MNRVFESRGHAVVGPKGVRRVRAGHPWIYRSDVLQLPEPGSAGFVDVKDQRGKVLGRALFSPQSTITLRLLQWGDEGVVDATLLRERLLASHRRRQRLLPGAAAFRLVHGEADFLPGVFIDRYGDCFALQTSCEAAEGLEPLLVELLVELFSPRAVVLRNDSATRDREKLRRHVTLVHGVAPVNARFHEGNVELMVDLLADQKTGSYLDQSTNHVLAARYGQGVAMDCFTYHGGFALQLAKVCERVTAYDQSEGALARARVNASHNGIDNVAFVGCNVFDLLPRLYNEGERFDTIVLDPPAFASSKHTLDSAARAYKEINLRAMRLLRPDSVLIACSCSGRVDGTTFDSILEAAARDARRRIYFVERRSAGPDHPVLAGVPETDYLKCRVLMVA